MCGSVASVCVAFQFKSADSESDENRVLCPHESVSFPIEWNDTTSEFRPIQPFTENYSKY